MAMWDGIENAGWGEHWDYAPRNLIDGVPLSIFGQTETTDDSFVSYAKSWYYTAMPVAFKDALNGRDFTVEIVFDSELTSNNGIFSVGGTSRRAIWIYGNGIYQVSTVNVMATWYTQGITPAYSTLGMSFVSVTGGSTWMLVCGDQIFTGQYGSLTSVSDGDIYIGGLGGSAQWPGAPKKFYCVRLYSRNLSLREILFNRQIDKARFGL